tara:strand:- start:908 stop:1243 length:336 start_codon:yes stop_codon:yes gene_type:complete
MTVKYFVDESNEFIGIFVDGALPPVGAKEVPKIPSSNHMWDGDEWVYSEDKHWERIRVRRDALLAETDILAALPDHPQLSDILTYRQALRDIPEVYEHPDDVVWPTKPEGV